MEVSVTLDGYGSFDSIMDLEVTLGQQDDSSHCTLTLADKDGLIADALIQHSLANGGIPALPKPVVQSQAPLPPSTPTGQITLPGGLPVARGAGFTPEVIAFLNLIAYKETATPQDIASYHASNGSGSWTTLDSTGFPTDGGTNVGRYQMSRDEWLEFKAFDKSAATMADPATQDRFALWRMGERGVLPALVAGDVQTAILKAGKEWASLPGAPYGQVAAGYTMNAALVQYNIYLGSSKQQNPDVSTLTKTDIPSAALLPITQPVKGSKITISLGSYVFTFFHQGTQTNQDGKTEVEGQGVRWVLSRRKRSNSYSNLSLKQLAQQIATAHGVLLNWQADFDINYEHIDQSGITDYQLLVRECKQAGLIASEDAGVLTVKGLRQLVDSKLYLEVGVNLISYQIADKAMNAMQAPSIDSLLQGEAKAELDPISGTFKYVLPDVDQVKDLSVTGAKNKVVSGKTAPGQEALQQQNRARLKRVKGLPSSFVIPLDDSSLQLHPLSVVRTRGISPHLDRVWMVDLVTHNLAAGTTRLSCFSPVEVVDNTPQLALAPPTNSPATTATTGYCVPCDGQVTSPFGPRSSPGGVGSTFHKGTDIANNVGTPVYAANDGVVVSTDYNSLSGNVVQIRHQDGFMTQYHHLSGFTCSPGQQVKKLQQVGIMGSTGSASTGSHCHFGVKSTTGNLVAPSAISLSFLANKGLAVTRGQVS